MESFVSTIQNIVKNNSVINIIFILIKMDYNYIVLMRHGISCANKAPIIDVGRRFNRQPLLTLTGIDQVMRSVNDLQTIARVNNSFQIVCSMLPRSIFTACIVASKLGTSTVNVIPYLGEQHNARDSASVKWNKQNSTQNYTTLHESRLYESVIQYMLEKLSLNPVKVNYQMVESIPDACSPVKGNDKLMRVLIQLQEKKNVLVIGHGGTLDTLFVGQNIETWYELKERLHKTTQEANCAFRKCKIMRTKRESGRGERSESEKGGSSESEKGGSSESEKGGGSESAEEWTSVEHKDLEPEDLKSEFEIMTYDKELHIVANKVLSHLNDSFRRGLFGLVKEIYETTIAEEIGQAAATEGSSSTMQVAEEVGKMAAVEDAKREELEDDDWYDWDELVSSLSATKMDSDSRNVVRDSPILFDIISTIPDHQEGDKSKLMIRDDVLLEIFSNKLLFHLFTCSYTLSETISNLSDAIRDQTLKEFEEHYTKYAKDEMFPIF
jgi:broad specificity phosphatase PhoE